MTSPMPDDPGRRPLVQQIGLLAGPAAFLVILAAPAIQGLDPLAQRTLAMTAWVAIWWLTEPVSCIVTGLIPFVLLPTLGVMKAEAVARAYQHDVIFLFLGGSLLAHAVERSGLHQRMANALLRTFGQQPRRFLAGYLAAITMVSLWMSNTATTLLFLPSAIELGAAARRDNPGRAGAGRFAIAILLATALGSSIGGLGTPIGTAPNMILVRGARETLGLDLSFATWARLGIPLVVCLATLLYVTLTFVTCRFPKDLVLTRDTRPPGPWTSAQRRTAVVFALAVVAWITRNDVPLSADHRIPGWASGLERTGLLPAGAPGFITDGTVAIAAALVLFLLPRGRREGPILAVGAFEKMPWGVLLLLGSSFVLAEAFDLPRAGGQGGASLSAWLSQRLEGIGAYAPFVQLVVIALVVTFAGELASNTAIAALLTPIGFRIASALGAEPLAYGYTITFAASCSFMLPVATPPNTLVYGTGLLSVRDMMRAGFVLDVCGALLAAALVTLML